jgi:hypothetical protein
LSRNPVVTAILDRELIVQRAELHFDSRAEQIMSMPALRPRRWTIDEVELLIDQRQGMSPRYELVDGELLVTPAPSERHQRIVLSLALLIQRFVSREGIGEIRLGPSLLPLTSGERFEPDLHVVPAVDGRIRPELHPLLVCEVLSPWIITPRPHHEAARAPAKRDSRVLDRRRRRRGVRDLASE